MEPILKGIYLRKETYSVDYVLSRIIPYQYGIKTPKVDFDGDMIDMTSQRYALFRRKGCTCVKCGLIGTYFAKEKSKGQLDAIGYHFNLYGINENGKEILITKDHYLAKSKGGKNHISNYEVLCQPCNHDKGNKTDNYKNK